MSILQVFEGVLLVYFSGVVVYTLGMSLVGHFQRKRQLKQTDRFAKIAVLVAGYKEDNIILSVAQKHVLIDYPREHHDIVIIADSFQQETIDRLSQMNLTVLPVKFDKSAKSKSLNYALNHLPKKYDLAVILDADNIVKPDFLHDINTAYQNGYQLIQARRVAKNTDTPLAVLDAASEAINNHIFRKGPNAIGLSACLIGSGIAIKFDLLRELLGKIDSVYEDRELQLELSRIKEKIHYFEDIIVFDEKVDNPTSYQNQRKRWIYAQIKFLKDNFFKGFAYLFRGNLNYFNFAILNNIFPPRLMAMFMLLVVTGVFYLIHLDLSLITPWLVLSGLYLLALLVAVPAKFYNAQLLRAFFYIPVVLARYPLILMGMRKANKAFIHTPHNKVDIDNTFLNTK